VYAAQPLITHFRRLKVIYGTSRTARRRALARLVTTLIKEIVPSILTSPLIFPAGLRPAHLRPGAFQACTSWPQRCRNVD